jgi:alanyl-tRNA synthetase
VDEAGFRAAMDAHRLASGGGKAMGRMGGEDAEFYAGIRKELVVSGKPKVGDQAVAEVDAARRHDIMRNHTATHLLHRALHEVLGEHARQAGSLVAPDRLRFDFNHPEGMTPEQIERVEQIVNEAVAADMLVQSRSKSREAAISEGAMALFGEKYGDVVRTITIGSGAQPRTEQEERYSYELCGGTHLERTSDVGMFLLVSEGSAAAGVRRIEAVTGRGAYELVAKRFKTLKAAAAVVKSGVDDLPVKVEALQDELAGVKKQVAALRVEQAAGSFEASLANVQKVAGVALLAMEIPGADKDALGKLADKFREKYSANGICVIAAPVEGSVVVMATVTQDLIKRGVKAGDLVGYISRQLGAGGGGAPHLAFGGGKDAAKVPQALASVKEWVEGKLK